MITYLGSLTIGACLPSTAAVLATAYADLQARVTALASVTFAPIVFTAQLALAESIVASINAMITLGISPPTISAQIAIVTALLAELEAELAIILNLQGLFLQAGVFAYRYSGRADAFGADLTTALSAGFPGGTGADNTNALVLATTTPACWSAMQGVFRTTP
jgi:hypothetical protein